MRITAKSNLDGSHKEIKERLKASLLERLDRVITDSGSVKERILPNGTKEFYMNFYIDDKKYNFMTTEKIMQLHTMGKQSILCNKHGEERFVCSTCKLRIYVNAFTGEYRVLNPRYNTPARMAVCKKRITPISLNRQAQKIANIARLAKLEEDREAEKIRLAEIKKQNKIKMQAQIEAKALRTDAYLFDEMKKLEATLVDKKIMFVSDRARATITGVVKRIIYVQKHRILNIEIEEDISFRKRYRSFLAPYEVLW